MVLEELYGGTPRISLAFKSSLKNLALKTFVNCLVPITHKYILFYWKYPSIPQQKQLTKRSEPSKQRLVTDNNTVGMNINFLTSQTLCPFEGHSLRWNPHNFFLLARFGWTG